MYGLWVTLESGSITEIAVALDLDFVVVDAEHGHLDWRDVLDHIRASVRSDTVLIVRVAELQEGLIKRVLDIGADGIIVPHIETEEQLRQALSFARYPPQGIRGIGAERATGWGQCFVEHVEQSDDILVIPLIESVTAGDNIDALARVEGVDIFFVGPADYAASAGHAGQWDVPGVREHINHATEVLNQAGKICGIVATTQEEIENRKKLGYRMFAIGFDVGLIIKGIRQVLTDQGRDRTISSNMFSKEAISESANAASLPGGYEPDREECIYLLQGGKEIELDQGVQCKVLVGGHTEANNLSTAIVTFDAGAVLDFHTHPVAESITLLTGHALVEVDNRRYKLYPLDNITIPKNCVHRVENLSEDQEATFHVAFPTIKIERTWQKNTIDSFQQVPDDFSGHLGPERITRYKNTYRYEAGPHTEFIDYFNDMLIPGVGMSGGYGKFYPNGRLPAHLHDFDESICIVEGEATCWVEGRKYTMSNLATAQQPRGRIHYFKNLTSQEMAMIWVYAGPMPLRIEVADEFATEGINRNKI